MPAAGSVCRLTAAAAVLLFLTACGGAGTEGVARLSVNLPAGWVDRLDMGALSAPVGTPYIGSIRVAVNGGGGSEVVEVPYDDRKASFPGLVPGGGYSITVQAITQGQVVMEKDITGVALPGDKALDLTIDLEEAGGFSYAGSLMNSRQQHSAVAYSSGILVLGGNLTTGEMESVGFSGSGFTVSAFADSLAYPRSGQKAFLNPAGDEILVFLGGGPDRVYEVVDLANLNNVSESIVNIRSSFFPSRYGSTVYLIGGYDENPFWLFNTLKINMLSKAEMLLTTMGLFTEITSAECLTLLDKMACLGGKNGGAYTGTVDIYDLTLETQAAKLTLSSARSNFATAVLPGGKLLVSGGIGSSGISRDVDILDLVNYTVATYPDALLEARVDHTATVLADGRVLLVGGGGSLPVMVTSEILDPDTGVSVPVPWHMRVPRYDHTATLLPDGRVLVMGGSSGDLTMEVYNP